MNFSRVIALFATTLTLSACGGGGGGGPSTPANSLPVVNAGSDQSVNEQVQVTLTGTATDTDGTVDTLLWEQTAGPNVSITNSDALSASFTAPTSLTNQTLTFRLTATDNAGGSASDTITITVNTLNALPVVDAGTNQTVNEGTNVVLSGTATDADGIQSTIWQQVSGPSVTLNNASSLTAGFTAPVTLSSETLMFRLTATDTRSSNNSDTVTITVNTTNALPAVEAGANQTVNESTSVSLTGTATDADGIQSVVWEQINIGNNQVTITNASSLNASFTAPATLNNLSLTFRLTATDTRGTTASDTVTINVNTTNVAPAVDAGANQTVNESTSVSLTGTATDADGIQSVVWEQINISDNQVTITNASTLNASFTAPATLSNTSLTFRLTATDNRGTTASDTVSITVNTTNVNPVAAAGNDQSVFSGDTVTLNGSSSSDNGGTITAYLWTQTAGPTVSLTSASSAITTFSAPSVNSATVLTFSLRVTDNRGATNTDTIDITVSAGNSTISGLVQYDNVPHNSASALDFANTTQDPVRGAQVQLIDATTVNSQSPTILGTTQTTASGNYTFNGIQSGRSVVVRVSSIYAQTANGAGTPSWDFRVVDNTNNASVYAIQSSAFTLTNGSQTMNLNAASGYNLSAGAYQSPRAAAPFHILDRAYDMVQKLVAADSDIAMPPLVMNWSVNNIPASGNLAQGRIGTSFYSDGNVYILGSATADTDEYDGHVVIHEMGHYFEDRLSRSDSIGGSHSGGQRLDMRVAFGEGFGNAWSGMITDDPFYRDSLIQSGNNVGFAINVENNNNANPGWYSEGSVQSILYDLYDSTNETGDTVSLGLTPIYNVLVGAQRTTPVFTSIFSFIDSIKTENPGVALSIDSIVNDQSIVSSTLNALGSTETNNAGNATHVLPVYTTLTVDGPAQIVCSIDDFEPTSFSTDRNKLSELRFIRFAIANTGNYSLNVAPVASGSITTLRAGGVLLFRDGTLVEGRAAPSLSPQTTVVISRELTADEYTATVFARDNTRFAELATTTDGCYSVTLTSN